MTRETTSAARESRSVARPRARLAATWPRAVAALAVVGLVVPGLAAAAPGPPAIIAGVRLTWDAPAGACPAQPALAERLRFLLGEQSLALAAHAEVQAAAPSRFRLTLQLRWAGGSLDRELSASDCETLAQATTVLIAVLAAPVTASQRLGWIVAPPPADATSPAVDPADPPAPTSASPGEPFPVSPESGHVPVPPAAGPEPTPSAPASPDAEPAASRPPASDPLPAAADDLGAPPDAPRTRPRPRRLGLAARISAVGGYGVLPRGDFGLALALGWMFPRVRLEGTALVLPGQALALADGSGHGGMIRLAAGGVRACPRFLGGPVELAVCGSVEAGASWTTSIGLAPERRASGPWLALGLGGLLEGWFSPQVGVHLAVEMFGAPIRTSYGIGGALLASSRPVGVRGFFGLTIALGPQKLAKAEKKPR